MDYEKAYKEALERARELSIDGYLDAIAIDELFTELAESEDEKMREELIRSFKSLNTIEIWNGIKRSDILAWLEKQGEQKETLCDKCKKEQPSHSCQDITALGRCALEKQGEHKPAWSKADKRMMDLIISVFEVNHPKSIFKDGLRAVYTDDIVSWLKSIEDRMKGE